MNNAIGSSLLASVRGGMINADAGVSMAGYSYMYFIGNNTLFSEAENVVVCSVELSFMSGAHLLGIPRHPAYMSGLHIDTSKFETVRLEGNYNDVFSLWAEPNRQSDARYVLDPAAMVFTMDFCEAFYWEIRKDTLYFMSTSILPSLDIVDEFVRQIRPALEVPSDRVKNPAKLPYVHTYGREVRCPRCSEKLEIGRAWMECPQGHGFLITGAQMKDERLSEAPIEYESVASAQKLMGEAIECPYCHSEMKHTVYQNAEIVLDVCTKCPHRWLDGGEIESILE